MSIKNLKKNVFCLKQAKNILPNGAWKIILFSLWIKNIFLTPLADIFACFKEKLTKMLYIFLENKT